MNIIELSGKAKSGDYVRPTPNSEWMKVAEFAGTMILLNENDREVHLELEEAISKEWQIKQKEIYCLIIGITSPDHKKIHIVSKEKATHKLIAIEE